jgi:hypothetical protein
MHITRVRSCKIDNWTLEELEQMQSIGNERANLYWEGKKSKGGFYKPSSDASAQTRKAFIKDKFVKKTWVDESVGNPVELFHQALKSGKNPAEYIKNRASSQPQQNNSKPELSKLAVKENDGSGTKNNPPKKQSFDLLNGDDKPLTPKEKKLAQGQSHSQNPTSSKLAKQPSTELFMFENSGTAPKPAVSAPNIHSHTHSQPPKMNTSTQDEFNLLGTSVTPTHSVSHSTPGGHHVNLLSNHHSHNHPNMMGHHG